MKTLLCLAVLALSAQAQGYLVEYTTTEKDYESNFRYAVMCGDPDCNVPTKEVTHYKPFPTLPEAVEFMNCALGGTCKTRSLSVAASAPGSSGAVGVVFMGDGTYKSVRPTDPSAKFVRLLKVAPVAVQSEESEIIEKQPDKVRKTMAFKIAKTEKP